MLEDIRGGDWVNIDSVLLVKDGKLVLEEYFGANHRDTFHQIRSATKSIGSILVGIAVDRGLLESAPTPIYPYFRSYEPVEGWDSRLREVTVRDLLTMTSGFECDDLATRFACENAMHGTQDWVEYSLNLPMAHEPGVHWAYNSSSLILVGEIVAVESGMPLHRFADEHLFEPLGIDFRWESSPRNRAWIGGGARMRSRDMAKIGLMMANGGTWKGRRILSEAWIEESTGRHEEERNGVWYGYLWQIGNNYIGTEMVRAYWASGNGGQYIIVIPDHGLVAVFTGGNYDSPLGGQPLQMLVRYILPAFLHPSPPGTFDLPPDRLAGYTGVYELSFEPSAISTVRVEGDRLALISPEDERIVLTAHSASQFSGTSRHGPIAVRFIHEEAGEIDTLIIYGIFSEFPFHRRGAPARGVGPNGR
jgi:CubicO group peptidase (beta-lactamase class C family)